MASTLARARDDLEQRNSSIEHKSVVHATKPFRKLHPSDWRVSARAATVNFDPSQRELCATDGTPPG